MLEKIKKLLFGKNKEIIPSENKKEPIIKKIKKYRKEATYR